jgi:hypothetical protein
MTGCGCESCSCGTLPAEFVRIRYYFGQRLGVMELSDEALYHAGKMSFHNARLHGFGVVCGLRVEKQAPPAGTQSTVLRVSTGAAIDPCGREVVVGIDQCIDVAAWFAKNRSRPDLVGWGAGATPTLRVVIRYRECPSDPGPAPRDPCGCDNGGCEFGRVRESFELALITADEKVCASVPFPPTDALLAAFEGAGPSGSAGDPARALEKSLDTLIASGCPTPSDDLWLCLASFTLTFDANGVPFDLSDPDNTIPERRTLLPTNALQAMLLDLAAEGASAGLLAGGPRAGKLDFAPDPGNPTTAGTLKVFVLLAKKAGVPPPLPDAAIVESTFEPGSVSVSRLDATGWKDVTPPGAVTYDKTTSPPHIQIVFAQGLAPVTPFVLSFQPAPARPTIDENGSPLPPFIRRFRFVLDSAGSLALDPAV